RAPLEGIGRRGHFNEGARRPHTLERVGEFRLRRIAHEEQLRKVVHDSVRWLGQSGTMPR
ncbi:MAG: hypothetical protein ACREJM_09415, partial [Candidatus Saccharimonadales bacterium]